MLLYWGMFTIGFLVGSIFAYITFAPKKPEEDGEYESEAAPFEGKSRGITVDQDLSGVLFSTQKLNQSHQQKISSSN